MTLTGIGALAVVAALGLPATALAFTQQGSVMMKNWSASDRCVAAAQRDFPDYTPESNAKRNAELQQCLASQGLPPRDMPPPPK